MNAMHFTLWVYLKNNRGTSLKKKRSLIVTMMMALAENCNTFQEGENAKKNS